jgi:hypothetical protein
METLYIYPARSSKIICRLLSAAQGLFVEEGQTWQFNNKFENLEDGEYALSVKDSKELVDTIEGVKIPAGQYYAPFISMVLIDRCSNNDASDGKITVFADGGVPPYQYSMDNVFYQESNEITGLWVTYWQVFVMDSNGYVASLGGIWLGGPEHINYPIINSITIGHCSQVGIDDGRIRIEASGGSEPYEYKIDDEIWGSNNDFIGLAYGGHEVHARDALNNSVTLPVNIDYRDFLDVVSIVIDNCSAVGADDGRITVSATSQNNPPVLYKINDGEWLESGVFENLAPGEYDLGFKDSSELTESIEGLKVSEPAYEYVHTLPIQANVRRTRMKASVMVQSISAVVSMRKMKTLMEQRHTINAKVREHKIKSII